MNNIYLFASYDNGYGNIDYTYFLSSQDITQEMCNKFISQANTGCGRIGSNFNDFKKGALLNNIKIQELKSHYKLTDVKKVLKNISGNY